MPCSTLKFVAVFAISVNAAADSGAPAFEVASLKPSGPIEPLRARLFEKVANSRFGSLPGDGNRVKIERMSAAELIALAYQIPMREIVGPSWMADARFEVEALIPEGESRSKGPAMLLTLLQERLALKAHSELRRMSGYILSVGKDGPKLKETGPPVPTKDVSMPDHSGPRFNGLRVNMNHGDMAQLTNVLSEYLQAPVEDQTGLKGHYAIEIRIPNDARNDEADYLAAFREALGAYGLHLATAKVDASILVVDNLSRTPAAN